MAFHEYLKNWITQRRSLLRDAQLRHTAGCKDPLRSSLSKHFKHFRC